jgi:hypothetical protein
MSAWRMRLSVVVMSAGLLVAGLPGSALGVVDPDTLVASLDGNNIPSDGDPGGSGSFSVALDPALSQACFELDVTLTDLAGDPPTAVDIHDSTTGDPSDVVLALAVGVDGAGHASGCVAASAPLVSAMLAAPNNYYVDVHTAGYPGGAVRGWLQYSYPVGELSVYTKVCPAAIQSVADLTEQAKASCLVLVLPADDIAPYVPSGYTVTGYGGTATFDYHVTDGKHLDATISGASRGGGGTCSPVTKSCNFSWLPYVWSPGVGEFVVTPTLLPAGTRFGSADARDGQEPGDPIPLSIGAGNALTVDSTGKSSTFVDVYLFRTPDATSPTVTTPTVSLRAGATFSSAVPIRLAWAGADGGSGIGHYAVQRKKDDGAWTTLAASVRGTSYSTSLAAGHAYRFRVVAYDKAGNRRTSGATALQHGRVTQDTSSRVRYAGTWHRIAATSASGGSLHYSKATGATASLTFRGRAVAVVAPTSWTRGAAKIYLDGRHVTTISLYGPAMTRQVVYTKRFATLGTHTIKVKIVGTAGHPRVDVDAFMYLD